MSTLRPPFSSGRSDPVPDRYLLANSVAFLRQLTIFILNTYEKQGGGGDYVNQAPFRHSSLVSATAPSIIRGMKATLRVLFLLILALGPGRAAAQTAAEWEARAKAAVSGVQGRLQVPGLRVPVKVARDHWGLAHIHAQNQHDLFFAQGFVAAQDRLFQMELWKRSGQGRLAEAMGESELQHDIRARLMRYRGD